MEQEKMNLLVQGGINVEEVLERFMQNEELLERFMKKFLLTPTYETLRQAIERGDHEQALSASHSLKGMCCNLSMTDMASLLTRQVVLLRENDFDAAAAMMGEIEKAYEQAEDAIRRCWQ